MSAHTPGPWRAQLLEGPGHWQIVTEESILQVALARHWPETNGLNSPESLAKTKANALLIAAAPDLLDSLYKIEVQLSMGIYLTDPEMQAVMLASARAALAKAKGGAP